MGDASSKGSGGGGCQLKTRRGTVWFLVQNALSWTLVGVVRSPDLQQQHSMSDAVPHHEQRCSWRIKTRSARYAPYNGSQGEQHSAAKMNYMDGSLVRLAIFQGHKPGVNRQDLVKFESGAGMAAEGRRLSPTRINLVPSSIAFNIGMLLEEPQRFILGPHIIGHRSSHPRLVSVWHFHAGPFLPRRQRDNRSTMSAEHWAFDVKSDQHARDGFSYWLWNAFSRTESTRP